MQAQDVQMGTITGVRTVQIRHMSGNSDAVVGTIAGGVAGALSAINSAEAPATP